MDRARSANPFVAERFGYGEIRTPMFESTELFVRGVGETTDIVEKEMYTFTDRGDRELTLRPEWTAPVVRAALEHALLATAPRGCTTSARSSGTSARKRAATGSRISSAIECFGFAGPEADVEGISLAWELTRAYGIDRRDAQRQLDRRRRLPAASIARRCSRIFGRTRRAQRGFAAPAGAQSAADARQQGSGRPAVRRNGADVRVGSLCDACREHFDAARVSETRSASRTSSIRRSCAGSITTIARCSKSPRARSARRARSAAAAATTVWCGRWAARTSRRSASRSGWNAS